MAIFKPGIPVVTREPVVEVTANREFPLKAGLHRFQLVVEDDAGNVSAPDIVEVVVADVRTTREIPDASGSSRSRRPAGSQGRRSIVGLKTKRTTKVK